MNERNIRCGASGVASGLVEMHDLDSCDGRPAARERTATSLEATAFSNLVWALLSFSELTVVFLQLA